MSTSNVIGALGATFSHSHFHVNQTNSIATVTDSGQNLVPFSTTVSSSGSDITYSAGKFTLQPNKTYKLDLAAAAATAAVTS